MAAVVTNRGLYELATQAGDSVDVRQAVWTGTRAATDATVYDWNTLSDLDGDSGLTEATQTNYNVVTLGGQDLAGVAVAEDDTGDEATWTATAYTINSVGSGGSQWTVCASYRWTADTLAGGILYIVDTPASPVTPNGGNITLPQFDVTINRA